MPSNPQDTYRGKGWVSWPDWLGYAADEGRRRRCPSGSRFPPYEEARALMHSHGLVNKEQFKVWCTQGNRPKKIIPSHPEAIYKGKGWKSWADWLGHTAKTDEVPCPLTTFQTLYPHLQLAYKC